MRNTINDEKTALQNVATALGSQESKKIIEDAIKKTIDWLEQNQNSEKTEYEREQKTLEDICKPLMAKIPQGAGSSMPDTSGFRSPAGHGGSQGPTIEEVD